MLNESFSVMGPAWGIVACMMLILWGIQVKTKNAGYVDLGWTLGLAICATFYFIKVDGFAMRKGFILTMVCLWAMRLVWLLLARLLRDSSEDRRYQRIRADWKEHTQIKFFFLFQFQGFLDVILSVPFFLIMRHSLAGFHPVEYVAILLWLVGFLGEIAADEQLTQFKNDPQNRGKTCRVGLWNYSRHPNYFFEWLMWVAYSLFALTSPGGWIAMITPLLMYYFLMHVSGVPLAEAQALKTRGEDYRRYQETTSPFIPWIRKRG